MLATYHLQPSKFPPGEAVTQNKAFKKKLLKTAHPQKHVKHVKALLTVWTDLTKDDMQ